MSFMHMYGIILVIGTSCDSESLPEPIIPYDSHNSVCYGPGTHNYEFRPSCPDNDSVIAVQSVRVGAKPLQLGCPRSITEITNHTGSYLVDSSNTSNIVDVTECCFPDLDHDCLNEFTYLNSGTYVYHISTSGYSVSNKNLEVSWQRTGCNDSTKYPIGTQYMYMNYSCIDKSRIGNLCSNSAYTITDGAFYLYNNGYPDGVTADIKECQCHIESKAHSIDIYTLDVRLEEHGGRCAQVLNIADSTKTTSLDCISAPNFNITKQTRDGNVTVRFFNDMPVDDGHIWICVSGEAQETIRIECSYSMDDVSTTSTLPMAYTSGETVATTTDTGNNSNVNTEYKNVSPVTTTTGRHTTLDTYATTTSTEEYTHVNTGVRTSWMHTTPASTVKSSSVNTVATTVMGTHTSAGIVASTSSDNKVANKDSNITIINKENSSLLVIVVVVVAISVVVLIVLFVVYLVRTHFTKDKTPSTNGSSLAQSSGSEFQVHGGSNDRIISNETSAATVTTQKPTTSYASASISSGEIAATVTTQKPTTSYASASISSGEIAATGDGNDTSINTSTYVLSQVDETHHKKSTPKHNLHYVRHHHYHHHHYTHAIA